VVIDDNAVNCFILGESLKSWGFEVATFAEPEPALQELAGGREFALVLLDKQLSGSDGFAAGARIRAVAPKLPMILLSSDHCSGDNQRSAAAGFAGFAVTPVKRADLFRMVCQALGTEPAGRTGRTVACTPTTHIGATDTGISLLIAEDSDDNRLLMEAYLKGSPHKVTFAPDGAAAVEAFARDKFDLILMDLQMPRMDGLTATRKIRALEVETHIRPIPIVALSANARAEDVALSREAGCNGHLSKPISKTRLLAGIAELAVHS
jgi:CheY-like chemotaxis protein